MNRSKIITATALATVMTAGVAHAEMSISGAYVGGIQDKVGATAHTLKTNSLYVTYSDSLDNDMNLGVAMSITGSSITTTIGIDTGFGSVELGNGGNSAVDDADGSPAEISMMHGPRITGMSFADGDNTGDGDSIKYIAPSLAGLGISLTHGFDDGTYDKTTSVALSYNLMGVSLKAGVSSLDVKAAGGSDTDPSFFTAAYTIAGLNLGYAMYDNDVSTGDEETQMGVNTSLESMGITVGATFAELDTSTVDTDAMLLVAKKSMGPMTFAVEYLEVDASNAAATDTISLAYSVGF